MVSRVISVADFDLVIFGGTGDLARRKILPALYRRFLAGQIPKNARIVAASHTDMDPVAFRILARDAITAALNRAGGDLDALEKFLKILDFARVEASQDDGWEELKAMLRPDVVRVFYFSVVPLLFSDIAERIHCFNLAADHGRIVIEKPFGHDLASAEALNANLLSYFDEAQIYRIDHYLGKETVQNLMALRFGNILFEPLWNAQFVDHVQITVAETIGLEGRGAYYDKAGAMRDMVQNHMMQLLCLTAMEPPNHFEPDAVRDEKVKVIRALEGVAPEHIVRGRYRKGEATLSYNEATGNSRSLTESYIALKLGVANLRWKGTPFYLRTGKRLKHQVSEIAIQFKKLSHEIFGAQAGGAANKLIIRLQPDERVELYVTIKEPGPGGMRLIEAPLDMSFAGVLGPDHDEMPDAYERLIMDVVRGDQTLFMRGDEVKDAWVWADPVIHSWCAARTMPFAYAPGSQGPAAAAALLAQDGRAWRDLAP